ncbi:sulfotransferase domain-containing protein [Sedimentitalea sp. HM32M-2]|uniref:sulfotransferase domain-containing protein n=1 Tax=Sedimentitalea sp. HM32M-2 TaxID=3351566 RepID=UPI0036302A4A
MPDLKSVLALSMHKAGSSITDNILTQFALAKGYQVDHIAKQVQASPLDEGEFFQAYQEKMQLTGWYYGMARGPYVEDLQIIPKLRTIVQLRDPRDCLTSAYFSFAISHKPPEDPEKRQRFEQRRAALLEMEIDDFVLKRAMQYRRRMRILKRIIDRHDDVLVLTYEEMVTDTPAWLNRIAEFLDQPLTDDLVKALGRDIDFTVRKEDVGKHKRQVRPGDHRRKLKPATIKKVSKVLEDELQRFNYAA